METQTDWTQLSTRELLSELRKRQKELELLAEAFPERERPVARLMAKGVIETPLHWGLRPPLQQGPNGIIYAPPWLLGKFHNLRCEINAMNSELDTRDAPNEKEVSPPKIGYTADAKHFAHSDDYTSVTLGSETYTLTSRQAQMIGILHRAYQDGNPDVAIQHILAELGTLNGRWQDTWRSSLKAKEALIGKGSRRGYLRLNI